MSLSVNYFVCFYLYVYVVNFIDYSDMDKMMDISNSNNELEIIKYVFTNTLYSQIILYADNYILFKFPMVPLRDVSI